MADWMKESRNPKHRPTLKDFREASKRLDGVILRTPLIPLRKYREEDTGILLKPEVLQPIGSYKLRGVYNWIAQLSPEERRLGISTLSAGNMSQAVGYVTNLFKVPARVAILDTAPRSKVEATRRYGAEVDLVSMDTATAYLEHPPHNYCLIHPMNEYGLMDGYGTIGLEVIEDAPDVETIFVPVGMGLLSAGVALGAKALKSRVRVIGVQAKNSPHFYVSFRKGEPTSFVFKPSVADAIADPITVSRDSLELIKETLDDIVLVPEDEIERAIRLLALENKLVTEGAGAISLAAALAIPREERGKSVCILSGGSIDAVKLAHILEEK